MHVGCCDIVEGNFKLTLGFIWSLIMQYQICGMGYQVRVDATSKGAGASTKQVLIDYVKVLLAWS